ncbi:MAG: 50S ribosomal protein L18 [Candidatus Shapirobacteria bacterium]
MIIHNQKIRRQKRIRGQLKASPGIPRLSVFRSHQHLWLQIIDDKHGKTMASANTRSLKSEKLTKTQKAFEAGKLIAKAALKKNIKKVKFDRGLYLFHGRVRAVAEGAREAGLLL